MFGLFIQAELIWKSLKHIQKDFEGVRLMQRCRMLHLQLGENLLDVVFEYMLNLQLGAKLLDVVFEYLTESSAKFEWYEIDSFESGKWLLIILLKEMNHMRDSFTYSLIIHSIINYALYMHYGLLEEIV